MTSKVIVTNQPMFTGNIFIIKVLLKIVFLLFTINIWAEPAVPILDDDTDRIELTHFMSVYEDKNAELSIEDVAKLRPEDFYSVDTTIFYEGISEAAFWLKVTITDQREKGPLVNDWILEVAFPSLNTVSLYTLAKHGGWHEEKIGASVPYDVRKYDATNAVFDVPMQKGESRDIYLRIQSDVAIEALFFIWQKRNYFDYQLSKDFAWGAYFGVVCILFLFNAHIWFRFAPQGYLYTAWLVSLIMTLVSLSGYGHRYLWGDYPTWNRISVSFFIFMFTALSTFTVRTYFFVPKIIFWLGQVFAFTALAFAIAVIYQQELYPTLSLVFLSFLYPTGLILVIFVKPDISRYFSISLGIIAFCMLVYILHLFSFIPPTKFSFYSIYAGTILWLIIYSLFFSADNIDSAQQATKEHQRKSLDSLQKYSDEKNEREKIEKEKIFIDAQNKAKSQFFASMSHELRTPLTSLLGYASMAKDPYIPDSQRIEKIATIEKSGRHLLQLVNDTLDLSKIEAQALSFNIVPVKTIELIKDIEDYFSILAEKKKLQFKVEYQFPLPETFDTDPIRLKQVLINLCSNAIKFTEVGNITLIVYVANSNTDGDTQQICFAVHDTGVGIAPEKVDILFDAFVQADSKVFKNLGGTGLGLYLSKQIVEQLRGNIHVTSTYGEGSQFTVELPLCTEGEIRWLNSSSQFDQLTYDKIPRLRGSVLYVEDDLRNQQLITELILRTGCQVTLANDSAEALDIAQQTDFNLVLTDIQMPIMDGIEFTRKLKLAKPNLPIVAVTAEYTSDHVNKLKQEKFSEILSKPITNYQLYNTLLTYLTRIGPSG